MRHSIICACFVIAAIACGGGTPTDGDDDDSGSGGAAHIGGAPGTGGTAGATLKCPAVCEKLDALFASFGPQCIPSSCNCKEACAVFTEAVVDCLPPASPSCTCGGNELDCGTLCDAEIQADNACWQAN